MLIKSTDTTFQMWPQHYLVKKLLLSANLIARSQSKLLFLHQNNEENFSQKFFSTFSLRWGRFWRSLVFSFLCCCLFVFLCFWLFRVLAGKFVFYAIGKRQKKILLQTNVFFLWNSFTVVKLLNRIF